MFQVMMFGQSKQVAESEIAMRKKQKEEADAARAAAHAAQQAQAPANEIEYYQPPAGDYYA